MSEPTTEAGRDMLALIDPHWLGSILAIEAEARAPLDVAARAVLRATDACRDALNGQAHEGPHDRDVHIEPCCAGAAIDPGSVHVYDTTGDCAQCGGAQYGTEDTLQQAVVDLRLVLGEPLLPHESWRAALSREEPTPDGAANFDAAVQRAFAGSGIEVRTSFTPTEPAALSESDHD